MKGDFHVRFRENVGVKFPRVTRLGGIQKMNKLNLKATKETGKLVEHGGTKMDDYALLIPVLPITIALGTKVYVSEFVFLTPETEKLVFLGLFTLSLLFSIFSIYKIKGIRDLSSFQTDQSKKEKRKAMKCLAEEQGWKIYVDNQEYFRAGTKPGILASKDIIVIYDTYGILVNVRLQQGLRGRFPFTFGKKKILGLIEKRIKTPPNPIKKQSPAGQSANAIEN